MYTGSHVANHPHEVHTDDIGCRGDLAMFKICLTIVKVNTISRMALHVLFSQVVTLRILPDC